MAIFVVGIVVGVVVIVLGVNRAGRIVDDFDRVQVGESATFDFEEGSYRIWLEGEGVSESSEFVEGSIVPTDDAEQVTTEDFEGSLTYDIGGHEGQAFETFDLDEAGEYEVTFDRTSSEREDRNLAIGQDNPLTSIGFGIGLGLLAMGLGFLVALIVLIVMFVKRSRSRRQAMERPGAAPTGGYGYPPPGSPGSAQYPPQPYPPPPQPPGYPPDNP